MTGHTETGYLDRLYADGDDPWQLAGSFYEQRKRELVLAALTQQGFEHGFEPACATGLLTEQLAERCAALLASDYHPRAVEQARARLAGWPAVRVRQMLLPDEWPVDERFDLIVLSEFGYFVDRTAWARICQLAAASLRPDAIVLACHWRHPFVERTLATAELHAMLVEAMQAGAPTARQCLSLADEDFQLDVWTTAASSVAARSGLR